MFKAKNTGLLALVFAMAILFAGSLHFRVELESSFALNFGDNASELLDVVDENDCFEKDNFANALATPSMDKAKHKLGIETVGLCIKPFSSIVWQPPKAS